jgi:hypothetical protein
VALRVAAKPRGFFQFSWQKGHVKESFPELIERGIYSKEQAEWNDEADKIAAIGAERHKVDDGIVKVAGMRCNVAQAVHAMYVELWDERMKDIGMEAEVAEEAAEIAFENGMGLGEFDAMADIFGDSFGLDGDLAEKPEEEHKSKSNYLAAQEVGNEQVVPGYEQPLPAGRYFGFFNKSNTNGEASSSNEPAPVKGDMYNRAQESGSSQGAGEGNEASSASSTSNVGKSRMLNLRRLEIHSSPYSRLVAQFPRYCWGKPCFERTSRLPTGQLVSSWGGRQVMRSGANHSFNVNLWGPFIKYLNLLFWGDEEEDEANENGGAGFCSYLAWVIDFELYTGLRVEDKTEEGNTTWARKAAVFACLYKAAIKYFKGPLSQEKIPGARVQVLLPFGVQGKFNSLGKRPLFLMKEKTEEMFARNALEWAKAPGGRQEFRLKYNLIKLPAPYWVDPNEERLEELLKERMKERNRGDHEKSVKRRRLHGKQPPKHDAGSN